MSVDSSYRRVTTANSSRRQAVEASGKGDPLKRWTLTQGRSSTSASGDASSDEVRQQGCFSAALTTAALRGLQNCLHTNIAV